jgi:anaerobic magnesium-protoporphyrin IX monomethyl ester cyclase
VRVLLGLPPYDFRDFYPEYMARKGRGGDRFGLIPGATAPLGLLYIASTLEQAGHEVLFLDGIFEDEAAFHETIERSEVELLGLLMMGYGWHKAQGFMQRTKERFADLPIVIGGPWPDVMQRECLVENAAIDYAASGDGEPIMLELVRCLERGGDVRDVRGLAWRDGDDVVVNPRAELVTDLDALPFPARHLIDVRRYSPAIGHYHRSPCTTMIGQRGCRNHCIFCHTNTWMRHGERFRSAGNVVDEMELLQDRHGVRDILFWDNNLTQVRDVIHARCEEMLRRDLSVIWSGNTRSDTLDLPTAKLMKRAGCWKLLIGFESGNQVDLDVLQKHETLAQMERAARICRQAGIRIFATFIFGIPGQTFEDGLRTIDFAKRIGADYTKFFTMGVHPGTALARDLDLHGTCLGNGDDQSHLGAGFVPHSMTREQLSELVVRANRAFYLRPSYLLYKLRTMRNLEDLRQNLRGFQAFTRTRAS